MSNRWLLGILLMGMLICGCGKPARPKSQLTSTSTQGMSEILDTLTELDTYVNVDLRPPKLILSAKNSSNKDEVTATLQSDPENRTPGNVYLKSSRANSRFQELQIVPGDIVRLYVDEAEKKTFDLDVLDVLSETELLVVGGLNEPVDVPVRMEIWRRSNDKLFGAANRLKAWKQNGKPPIGWEPSPDEEILKQFVQRLNQASGDLPALEWRVDPLWEKLPEPLRSAALPRELEGAIFLPEDGRTLQEVSWLRDVAYHAGSTVGEQEARATALFDWVMRHVQVETRDPAKGLARRPWEILLHGRGTVEDRAWLFILLARQLGLDAVALYVPSAEGDKPPRLFAVGVLLEREGKPELVLYDPRLALPLPGPGRQGIATLAQAASDESVLRQLDLDDEHRYPFQAADLQRVIPMIEASPTYLAKRMKQLETRQRDQRAMVLSVNPTALAERLKQHKQLGEAQIWEWPYEAFRRQTDYTAEQRQLAVDEFLPYVWRPMLYKARLADLRRLPPVSTGTGKPSGVGEETLANSPELRALDLYMRTRDIDAEIPFLPPSIVDAAKQHAGFWLGELAYDRQDYPVAIDYFQKRILEAYPRGVRSRGAKYNLARTLEAAGRYKEAVQWLEGSSTGSENPQDHGNRLRAKWIRADHAVEN